jgi:putative ABC transport system permease protein
MIAAVTASLVGVGAVLGAYAILTREIAVNYLGTRPASATLALEHGVDRALVEAVRARPGIAEAEARGVVVARARVGDDWRPLLLFVIDDFDDLRLNTFRPEGGAWPPPPGTMLVERTAVPMLEAGPGRSLLVKTPSAAPREVPITGLVHDPGLAPAWQERQGYGYVTRETLAALGEEPELRELRVAVSERSLDAPAIERTAAALGAWLAGRGLPVHEIRVPPPARHPHQLQMVTVLVLLLAFAGLALLLGGLVVAATLAAMLARQVREIGVMKTLGARGGQLRTMYAALVTALGTAAFLVAWPLGVSGAHVFSGAVARMLNFTLTSAAIPPWVFLVQAAAGVVVPLAVAAIPIRGASRVTVLAALNDHGLGGGAVRRWPPTLPAALRNVLRRPARLALTLSLLAAGGAMFMTALNVSRGWERNVAKVYETRSYDVEIRLHAAEAVERLERLREVPGVRTVEAWGFAPAAFARPGEIDVVRTYPDRAHGSLSVLAPPPSTPLVRFPLRAGRWLRPGDEDAVVLNHSAAAQAPGVRIGDPVALSIDGHPTSWRLAGIVEEIGSPGAAYVTDEAFARVSGTAGRARMIRVATSASTPAERIEVLRAVEASLDAAGVGVQSALPLSELRTAVGDHIAILIRALVSLAVIMAVVGGLGLGSAVAVGVLERTRELGVMKALGATPRRVTATLVEEALLVAGASWGLAFGLSLPLTALVDRVVGNLGFLAPLPLVIAPAGPPLWLALAGAVGLAAAFLPARRAAALTVREALART